MNKKVAFIAEEYSEKSFTSGGIKLNFEIIKHLLSQEYSVDVYSKRFYNLNKCCKNYFDFDRLKDIDLKKEYDFVLSEKAIYPSDITYIHDHSFKYKMSRMNSVLKRFFYKVFNSKKYKIRASVDNSILDNLEQIKTIIVSSEILKKDYVKNFNVPEDKIVILPPPVIGIEIPRIKTQNENEFVFGVSAVGFVRKGGYILLKALKLLKKSHKNFKVIIIYPKSEKNLYLQFLLKLYGIKNNVEFLPLQTNINKFYSKINCLILTSLVEPYGMVTTEALTAKIPVIVANHCGSSDAVINGENGYTFDFSKKPALELSKAMKKMIELDKETYEKMSEQAYLSARDFLSENFLEKYFNITEKTLHKN